MVTHIQLAIGFRASAWFHLNTSYGEHYLYIYKAEIICLSVCHADNSPGTAEIAISTA